MVGLTAVSAQTSSDERDIEENQTLLEDTTTEAGSSSPKKPDAESLKFLTGFSIALCNAVDAVETTAFGSVLVSYVDPATGKRLDETPELGGLLTSGVFIGMLLGGLVAGVAGDRFGRRPVLLVSMVVNAVSAIFSALCPRFPGREIYWLLFFRILAGVGVGGSVPCAFSLTAEWSPDSTRGFQVSLLNGSWTVGAIFTALAAWLILNPDQQASDETRTWPTLLFVCSLPAIVAFFLTYRYVTEAPQRIPVVQNTPQATARSTTIDSPTSNGSLGEQSRLVIDNNLAGPSAEVPGEIEPALFNSTLFIFAGIWVALGFGSYGVSTWIGDVFHSLGYKDPYAVAVAFSLASVPGTIGAVYMVERTGRKFLLGVGMIGSGLFAIGFSSTSNSVIVILCTCLFSVFVTFAWVGLGVMSTETFPFKTRTTSMGIAAAFGRVGSIVANIVNPFLLKNNMILGVAGAVLISGGVFGSAMLSDRTGKELDR